MFQGKSSNETLQSERAAGDEAPLQGPLTEKPPWVVERALESQGRERRGWSMEEDN